MSITKILAGKSGAESAEIIYQNDLQSYNEIFKTTGVEFKTNITPLDSANTVSAPSSVWIQKGYPAPRESFATNLRADINTAGSFTLVQFRLIGTSYVEVWRKVFTGVIGLSDYAISPAPGVSPGDVFGISGAVSYSPGVATYYSTPLTANTTFTKAAYDASVLAAVINFQVTIAATTSGILEKLGTFPADPTTILKVSDLTTITGANKFDKSTMRVSDFFVNNFGGFNAQSGAFYARIPVLPSTTYTFNLPSSVIGVTSGGAVRFEDNTNTLLSFIDYVAQPMNATSNGRLITTPASAAFMCINIKIVAPAMADQTDIMQVIQGTSLGTYIPYKKDITLIKGLYLQDTEARALAIAAAASVNSFVNNRFYGLTMEAMGDSMVKGHSLANNQTRFYKVAARLGMTYINSGINGNWLTSGGGTGTPLVNRYMDMSAGAKVKCIFIGTNDSQNNVTIGATNSTNPAEFNGALNIVLSGLQSLFPTDTILVWTPYNRISNSVNYVNAIIAACEKYGIPCFDNMRKGGINWANSDQLTALTLGDTYHLNDAGMTYAGYRDLGFITQF